MTAVEPVGSAARIAQRRAQDHTARREMENRVLTRAAQLDPDDHSLSAEQCRETAVSIRAHRDAEETRNVRYVGETLTDRSSAPMNGGL